MIRILLLLIILLLEKHNTYYIHDSAIKAVDNWRDLGFICSSDYTDAEHYKHLVSSANSQAGLIRRAFHLRAQCLMWPAFQTYVLPVFM